ncbi:MAG: hypothetical protein NUW23_11230 [Firmicutes bacterium]|nr:hypothetical protein [Bacillota bacterium]
MPLRVPFLRPKPDFEAFQEVILGSKEAERVHFVELFADPEIVRAVLRDVMGETPVPSPAEDFRGYWRQQIEFWYRMGYDYVRVSGGFEIPMACELTARDTASLSRGERSWVNEGVGPIASWADFEAYPWDKFRTLDYAAYEFVSRNFPDGMKMMVCPLSGVFEIASEHLLGFEGMSLLLYEDPDLVEAVFSRVGDTLLSFYRNLVTIHNVAGIFQGDDLGFKTSTFLSPVHLRRLVFPWHKRYAALAHERGQMYRFHCCGNLRGILQDLIDDVKIDALHSFQDEIMPVAEFQAACGQRVAALGGVDVDALCRMGEEELRGYVRGILSACMPRRYALGSGNTIANYVPVRNYLVMMDEGARWES